MQRTRIVLVCLGNIKRSELGAKCVCVCEREREREREREGEREREEMKYQGSKGPPVVRILNFILSDMT